MAEINTDDYEVVFALRRDGQIEIYDNGGDDTVTRLLGVAHRYAIERAVLAHTTRVIHTPGGGPRG